MNFALTDGHTIVATRFRNHPMEDPPNLYFSFGSEFAQDPDGLYRMHGEARGKRDTVLITTEPLTMVEEDWTLVPKNHIIVGMCSYAVLWLLLLCLD